MSLTGCVPHYLYSRYGPRICRPAALTPHVRLSTHLALQLHPSSSSSCRRKARVPRARESTLSAYAVARRLPVQPPIAALASTGENKMRTRSQSVLQKWPPNFRLTLHPAMRRMIDGVAVRPGLQHNRPASTATACLAAHGVCLVLHDGICITAPSPPVGARDHSLPDSSSSRRFLRQQGFRPQPAYRLHAVFCKDHRLCCHHSSPGLSAGKSRAKLAELWLTHPRRPKVTPTGPTLN